MSAGKFTEADIRRAIKAVESGGKSVAAVDFPKEGGFRLLIGDPFSDPALAGRGVNEWDDVLAA